MSRRCTRSSCRDSRPPIRAGAGSVMAAYNKVNGTWSAEQPGAPHGHPSSRVGLQGLRDVGLGRDAQQRAGDHGGPRSRDAERPELRGSRRRREERRAAGRDRRSSGPPHPHVHAGGRADSAGTRRHDRWSTIPATSAIARDDRDGRRGAAQERRAPLAAARARLAVAVIGPTGTFAARRWRRQRACARRCTAAACSTRSASA